MILISCITCVIITYKEDLGISMNGAQGVNGGWVTPYYILIYSDI